MAIDSLADDETIARLATGIKRLKLPEEFDFIAIYRKIAAEPKTGRGEDALQQLRKFPENRRQYDPAAEYRRRSIKEYGPGISTTRNIASMKLSAIGDGSSR